MRLIPPRHPGEAPRGLAVLILYALLGVALAALTGCNRGTHSAWPTQPPAFTGQGSQLSRHELAPFRRRTVQSYAAPIRAEDAEGWADLSTAEQDTVRTYLASRRSSP